MIDFYAAMIIKGLSTYQRCPDTLKPQVKDRLEALDAGHLVTHVGE